MACSAVVCLPFGLQQFLQAPCIVRAQGGRVLRACVALLGESHRQTTQQQQKRRATPQSNTVEALTGGRLLVAGPRLWPVLAERLGVRQVKVIEPGGRGAVTSVLADRLQFTDAGWRPRLLVVA